MASHLNGHLDAVTSSGHVEGWATDAATPGRVVSVCVHKDGTEIAWGMAHLWRDDLVEARCGTGWCAFRLRTHVPADALCNGRLTLLDRDTAHPIHELATAEMVADSDAPVGRLTDLLRSDPTVVREIRQLRACEPVFERFIATRGAESFVRMAYVYVLNRPADDVGLAMFARNLRRGAVSPFGVIEALSANEEFAERRPMLSAPISSAFPFFL